MADLEAVGLHDEPVPVHGDCHVSHGRHIYGDAGKSLHKSNKKRKLVIMLYINDLQIILFRSPRNSDLRLPIFYILQSYTYICEIFNFQLIFNVTFFIITFREKD